MRKKLFALALATTVVLTFAACGDNGKTAGSSAPSSSAASSSPASSAAASSSPASSTADEETYSSLDKWFEAYADDIKELEDMMNDPSQLNGSGVSQIKMSADGNMFVYEYYLDDSVDWSSIPTETVEQVFDEIIEANSASMTELFEGFAKEFDFELEGLRFTFYQPDGSVFYTQDVKQ